MDILAPIDSTDEISVLSKAGASSFYCGYLPTYWIEKYNKVNTNNEIQLSLNRRDNLNANFWHIGQLENAFQIAQRKGTQLYLTLNFGFFPQLAYEDIQNYLEEVEPFTDGIIVTDVGLIHYLHVHFPNKKLILSTCSQSANNESNRFFHQLGISKITLPRHISSTETIELCRANPQIDFECFVLDSRCIYDDGNCRPMHSMGAFCQDQFQIEYFKTNEYSQYNYGQIKELFDNEQYFSRWTRMFPCQNEHIHNWARMGCGICNIPKMIHLKNMKTLKISGRGSRLGGRFSMVRLLNQAIKMAEMGANSQEMKELIKDNFGIPEWCDNRIRCYTHDNNEMDDHLIRRRNVDNE